MLIVGAGPAGTALAWQLSARGLPLTLLEASRRCERQFRGQGLMPSGLAALRALGPEAWPAAAPRRCLSAWSFVIEGRPFFTVAEPMGSTEACTLIDPGWLLRHWHDVLQQRPGVRLLQGEPVVGLLEEAGRVCGVRLADGTALRAALVVGCDGRDSLLRQRSALPYHEASAALELLWFRLRAADCRAIESWLGGRFVTLVGAGGSGALFARADGGVQLGWIGGGDGPGIDWRLHWAAAAPPPLAALLRALPRRAVRGPVRQGVRVGLAERWHRPGLLLLGDAAHPLSPVRAQGLNMALRDAVVAAAHLGPALAGPAGTEPAGALERALAAIEAERQPEIRAVQALQAEELERAELLRRLPWLRATLAATAPLSGPLLARRWRAGQRVLRDGLVALPQPGPP